MEGGSQAITAVRWCCKAGDGPEVDLMGAAVYETPEVGLPVEVSAGTLRLGVGWFYSSVGLVAVT